MADSDGEYIDDLSDYEPGAHQVTRGGGGRGGAGARSSRQRAQRQPVQRKARWEDIQRSWETVVEGADGSISSAVVGLLEAGKRRRLLKDTTPLQRGIIRHVLLALDLTVAMQEKDLRPTRYLLMLRYAQQFVTEFFEQNPIAQLGILGMRDGLAVRVSDMSGSPTDHLAALQALRAQEPKGSASLQNVLEMARGALFHAPAHGTREVVVVLGALSSSDPGDVHATLRALVADRIRVGVVGLAAEVALCRELVVKTNSGDDSAYGVALDEQHFHDLLMQATTPPVVRSAQQAAPSLLMMGFPSRIVEAHASLCACHSQLVRGGYLCTRCTAKVCALPAECPACGLTLILSTHLARSYQHLFPLRNWVEVPWARARRSTHCFACQARFPDVPREHLALENGGDGSHDAASGSGSAAGTTGASATGAAAADGSGVGATGSVGPVKAPAAAAAAAAAAVNEATGNSTAAAEAATKAAATANDNPPTGTSPVAALGTSPSSRYECTVCENHFCIDCDVWSHDIVHNCPGCLSTALRAP